ncbi:MAG: ABC transporter ATP-binding protein [Eubacteriales bacterium]|nr:ABC transporter ATP-binding protein [Eubacteriales bacterium]
MAKEQVKSKDNIYRVFKYYLRGIRIWYDISPKLMTSLIGVNVLEGISPLVGIYLLGRIVSALFSGAPRSELFFLVVLSLVSALLLSTLNIYFNRRRNKYWAVREPLLLRYLNDKLLRLDLEDYDSGKAQEQLDQIRGNHFYANMGLVTVLVSRSQILKSFFMIIGAVGLCYTLFTLPVTSIELSYLNNPLVKAGVWLVLIILPLLGMYFGSKSAKYWYKASELATQGNRLYSFVMSSSTGNKTALESRLFSQENFLLKWMTADRTFVTGGYMHKAACGPMGAYAVLGRLMPELAVVLASIFTVMKAYGGAFDLGQTTRYLAALVSFVQGLGILIESLSRNYMNLEYMEQTINYLDLPESEDNGLVDFSGHFEDFTFENLSYSYPGAKEPALKNISLSLKPGIRYALVGPNGSGKTTFIKLLTGFYRASEGVLKLNGRDLNVYKKASVMPLFTAIFQDFGLLAQTIGENIAAVPQSAATYDEAKVRHCLELAGLDPQAENFKNGLDTLLYKSFSDQGVNVSGGEEQKLAMARALYKPAEIFLMDEPTAALDPIAESEIYERLDQLIDERLALYVSHRLSSCKFCDYILVFEHGEIVQKGTHEELLADQSGLYKRLWEAQAKHYK